MLCSVVRRFHQNADIYRITQHHVSYKCNHNMDTYLNCSRIKNSGTNEGYGVDCQGKHMGLVGMM